LGFSSIAFSIVSSIIIILGIHSKASSIKSSVDFFNVKDPPYLQDSINPVLSSVFSRISYTNNLPASKAAYSFSLLVESSE
jgi:hypothetical protein